ncbi:aroma-sacti cluster domain-containing protein [Nonomuraea insulae]|uniref:Aroma-sacti cluster domain-containing protein n=1 Tax=Nonomuraea insulae TaxID=1616787 RepID=A0ABW1CME0_9ACTN
MSQFDALTALQDAGVSLVEVPEEQQAIFASLTQTEVTVLTSVKDRLDAATEVSAHLLEQPGNHVGVIIH